MSCIDSRRGSILAIGGHERRNGDMAVLSRFVSICGGPMAQLVVLTTASPTPGRKETEYRAAFGMLGVENVSFFHQYHRADCEEPDVLSALEGANGVFLAGGHQSRLAAILGQTTLAARLHERYRLGLHLAGTSAGAAVLGSIMISRGRTSSRIRAKPLEMVPGLSFLPGAIVDQHFHERDRLRRLLLAVASKPATIGFGVDEDTAFELKADNRVHVIGKGALTIVDGSDLQTVGPGDGDSIPQAFANMRVHVLHNGSTFDMSQHRLAGCCPVPEFLPQAG